MVTIRLNMTRRARRLPPDTKRLRLVLPKRILQKYAAFAANYGSIDNEFIVPGKKPTRVPTNRTF